IHHRFSAHCHKQIREEWGTPKCCWNSTVLIAFAARPVLQPNNFLAHPNQESICITPAQTLYIFPLESILQHYKSVQIIWHKQESPAVAQREVEKMNTLSNRSF